MGCHGIAPAIMPEQTPPKTTHHKVPATHLIPECKCSTCTNHRLTEYLVRYGDEEHENHISLHDPIYGNGITGNLNGILQTFALTMGQILRELQEIRQRMP
jgi:hypothetical protein